MSGSHLYFGYILASGDEYSFDTEMFDVSDIEKYSGKVQSELVKLQEREWLQKIHILNLCLRLLYLKNVDRREDWENESWTD